MTFSYIKNEHGHFVCPSCQVVKAKQNSMHYHMKTHMQKQSHVCKSCKKGFLQKQTLDLHIRSKHPERQEDTKKFSCPFDNCGFTSLTKGNCVIHCLRIHYQEQIKKRRQVDKESKTIACTVCVSSFPSSCAFYYHCKKCIPGLEKLDEIE